MRFGVFVFCFGLILGIVFAGRQVILYGDGEFGLSRRSWGIAVGAAFFEAIAVSILMNGKSLEKVIPLAIFAGCLLLACITDLKFCQVHNFVWWMGELAGAWLLFGQILVESSQVGGCMNGMCIIMKELVIFCGLQLLLFSRLYGKADCYAFLVCALVEASFGVGMGGYLGQMLLAYGLLSIVQGGKGNIARNGNLKVPVPFLPYITISFWGTLLWQWIENSTKICGFYKSFY